jgi:hypothetical protein
MKIYTSNSVYHIRRGVAKGGERERKKNGLGDAYIVCKYIIPTYILLLVCMCMYSVHTLPIQINSPNFELYLNLFWDAAVTI